MNLRKVGQIIRREYLESVRKKSFLFGLVATPLMMVGMIYLPLFAGTMVGQDEIRLIVLDETGHLAAEVQAALSVRSDVPGTPSFAVTVYGAGRGPGVEELTEEVVSGAITGWIRLPADFRETGAFEYHSESVTNPSALENIESRLRRVLARRQAAAFGMSETDIDTLLRPVEMRTFRIGRDGGEEADFTVIYLRAVVFVMILFFALMPTGQILMRSVIEEKANRVIEVLLSSVTPMELMFGKVLGLGAVGLTLIGAWGACGALLALRAGSLPIEPGMAGMFALYFFPGFFFYAAVLASVGSVCNSEREAQPFLTPISMMLIFPVMIGFVIAQSPDHLLARIFSFIPFFTPSLMLFRFAIKEPPAWEIAATWGVLMVSTVGMIWASSRIFRVGILMYGKRPTIPEIIRWVGEK